VSAPGSDAAEAEAGDGPVALGDEGRHYLRSIFLFRCAGDYLPYPDGSGPPVPDRTEREWAEREAELDRCLADVLDEYTRLETIRTMTWNGSEHVLSEPQMEAIARSGDAFLESYVEGLLRGERRREGSTPQRSMVGVDP